MAKDASPKTPTGAKMTVGELYEKMSQPDAKPEDFAKYFKPDEDRSRFFSPAVTFNPDLVDMGPTPQARARSEAALPVFNSLARAWRRADFNRKILSGYSGPVMVSEGDSWFQYPILLDDVIDNLIKTYAVSSLDAAGDTLDQMIAQDEYLDEIKRVSASILLFSGGGNDVLGGGDLKSHLRPFDPALNPAQHIKSSFNALLDRTIGQFDQIFRRVAREAPGVQIICHGYDYTVPNNGKWLGGPMNEIGITKPDFQKAIAAELIDRFAVAMLRLAARYPHVHFLDNRGTVTAKEWHDELHPVNSGYKKIADSFEKTIKQLSAKPREPRPRDVKPAEAARVARARAVPRPTGLNHGLSLHIGLNKIDPQHYGGECALAGCHNDANAMADIAKQSGYTIMNTLLDGKATAKAVRDGVISAAKELKAGDIFLLTYAGHGGQVPDFSGDERDDGKDETWCLYDRELLDDELYELWSRFKEGVRVLVVSDSCHSGSVIRATATGLTTMDSNAVGAFPYRVRVLPAENRRFAITNNRELYRKVAADTQAALGGSIEAKAGMRSREIDSPLACTVRLLSGCQDEQTSGDGDLNGLFTSRLLQVIEGGFRGNYTQFVKAIRKLMPAEQIPNHWVIGRKDPGFDAQQPFEI